MPGCEPRPDRALTSEKARIPSRRNTWLQGNQNRSAPAGKLHDLTEACIRCEASLPRQPDPELDAPLLHRCENGSRLIAERSYRERIDPVDRTAA